MSIDEVIEQKVLEILDSRQTMIFPELITVEETAKLLGDVSEDTIRRLAENRHKNQFPAVQVSSKIIKVNKTELIYWINNGGLFATQNNDELN